MNKTYKYTLPKGMEVEKTNVRVENGQILVDVELKEKFDPKDGDFLHHTYFHSTVIYKETYKTGGIITYAGIGDNGITALTGRGFGYTKDFRLATEEEKSALLDRLKNECGKTWNAEKKCLEDIYVPKFGDIVRIDYPDTHEYKRQYVISIFPNKEVPNNFVNDFFDICVVNMDGNLSLERHSSYNYGFVSPASESEKQELFDKLAEVGKRWNPETKQLEDIRWEPKEGESYFFVNSYGGISNTIRNTACDSFIVGIGNAFKTEEAAKPYADQIKEIFKNSKAE